jgi:hypothetical protein
MNETVTVSKKALREVVEGLKEVADRLESLSKGERKT